MPHKASTGGNKVTITTSKFKLTYRKDGAPLSAKNLTIASAKTLGTSFSWTPGMEQKGNLKGTYRTLGGYDGDMFQYSNPKIVMPLEDGLLATDGWTGWDWNERLFPDYKKFLSYLDEQGVKTTMNLHPADGVRPYEKTYQEFIGRAGIDAYRLIVDGKELFSDWGDHAETTRNAAIPVEAGKKYNIRIEYYDNEYNAILRMQTLFFK